MVILIVLVFHLFACARASELFHTYPAGMVPVRVARGLTLVQADDFLPSTVAQNVNETLDRYKYTMQVHGLVYEHGTLRVTEVVLAGDPAGARRVELFSYDAGKSYLERIPTRTSAGEYSFRNFKYARTFRGADLDAACMYELPAGEDGIDFCTRLPTCLGVLDGACLIHFGALERARTRTGEYVYEEKIRTHASIEWILDNIETFLTVLFVIFSVELLGFLYDINPYLICENTSAKDDKE